MGCRLAIYHVQRGWQNLLRLHLSTRHNGPLDKHFSTFVYSIYLLYLIFDVSGLLVLQNLDFEFAILLVERWNRGSQ